MVKQMFSYYCFQLSEGHFFKKHRNELYTHIHYFRCTSVCISKLKLTLYPHFDPYKNVIFRYIDDGESLVTGKLKAKAM